MDSVRAYLDRYPYPTNDGWGWLYRWFETWAARGSRVRSLICAYFYPRRIESTNRGRIYRVLGVSFFGRIIPTGGISIRRITGAKMEPYTLRGTSLGAVRDFYFRACVFEAAHAPFFLALLAITVYQLSIGRVDLALEDMLVNAVVNIYPMMHHRNTRVRIVRLLTVADHRSQTIRSLSNAQA